MPDLLGKASMLQEAPPSETPGAKLCPDTENTKYTTDHKRAKANAQARVLIAFEIMATSAGGVRA